MGTPQPRLIWDIGTAYDMFISLHVLHEPDTYGLRGSWAAGVRSRLPTPERDIIQQFTTSVAWPLHWVYTLPEPKDAETALRALAQMPAAERLPALALSCYVSDEAAQVLKDVAARQSWNKRDLTRLQEVSEKKHGKKKTSKEKITRTLALWSRPEETGEGLLASLQAYQKVFFAEEEKRILPALQEALAQARALAEELPLATLLEELSQGLRFDELEMEELILVPSFWATPLMIFMPLSQGREMYVFGGRPADASLVPGEVVPDALFQALKALADPTRLRILHYLSAEPLTPAELARRLRLRAPTVIHHLHTLRLARLVQLTLGHDGQRYAARREAIMAACDMLQDFLNVSGEVAEGQSAASYREGAAL